MVRAFFGFHALPSFIDLYPIDKELDEIEESYKHGIHLCRKETLLITLPIMIFIKFVYMVGDRIGCVIGRNYTDIIYSLFCF